MVWWWKIICFYHIFNLIIGIIEIFDNFLWKSIVSRIKPWLIENPPDQLDWVCRAISWGHVWTPLEAQMKFQAWFWVFAPKSARPNPFTPLSTGLAFCFFYFALSLILKLYWQYDDDISYGYTRVVWQSPFPAMLRITHLLLWLFIFRESSIA